MNLDHKKQIVYSKVLDTAFYALELYTGQTEAIKDKFTAIIMRANKPIFGMPVPLKTKNSYICKKIGKKTRRQLITEAGAKFIHKIINTQKPAEIFNFLIFPRNFRKKYTNLHQKSTKNKKM